jgi:cellulose synthase/poly-beta-1,6-N-acetylglucosamine synthase-like glycosyltransferase
VKKYTEAQADIHLLEFPRTGKSVILNQAMNLLNSEVVVFSDANTEYSTDAVKRLVRHFEDPDVGCVSGRLIYRNPGETISGKGESIYWKYETALKKMESKLGYVAGANGAIYAIRRDLFEPFPPRTINDDFTLSMKIVMKGFKCVYDENAIVYEDVAPTMQSEFNRHVRWRWTLYCCRSLWFIKPFLACDLLFIGPIGYFVGWSLFAILFFVNFSFR